MIVKSGTLINERFELGKIIGQGGFSQVWSAVDHTYDCAVALKLLRQQDEIGIRMCHQEFEKTRHLRHPNIVTPYHFDIVDNCPFLVMPFVGNGSCSERIGVMDEVMLARLTSQIGNALSYIHSLEPPMLHGDVKPDNILLDADNNFYLIDFGISRQLKDRFTATLREDEIKLREGVTPMAYRPPETFRYKGWQSAVPTVKADLWSFGVTLYYLRYSILPFNGEGGLGQLILDAAGGQELPEILELKQPLSYLDRVLVNCLQLQPDHRAELSLLDQKQQNALPNKQDNNSVNEEAVKTSVTVTNTGSSAKEKTIKKLVLAGIMGSLVLMIFTFYMNAGHQVLVIDGSAEQITDTVAYLDYGIPPAEDVDSSQDVDGLPDESISEMVLDRKPTLVRQPVITSSESINSGIAIGTGSKWEAMPKLSQPTETLKPAEEIKIPADQPAETVSKEVKTTEPLKAAAKRIVVKPNIPIPMKVEVPVEGFDDLREGSSINFRITENIISYGEVFLTKGTTVSATVRKIKNGKARVRFVSLRSTGGTSLNKLNLSDFEVDLAPDKSGLIYRPVTSGYQHEVLIK